MKIAKIQSGGRIGTELAALEIAKKKGLQITGYMPKNAECKYEEIKETPYSRQEQCIIWNVRDSHATLIISSPEESVTADLAFEVAENYARPVLISSNYSEILRWLNNLGEEITLNITGANIEEDKTSAVRTAKVMEKVLSHFDSLFIMGGV